MQTKLHLLAALAWTLVVFYPNPVMLLMTIWHTISPPINAAAAHELAATLPDDPNAIRYLVLTELVTYDYDWAIYGVPWYFPRTSEVIRDRRGDCESQAVLLASILEAKGIPYQLKMSFDHMWIDYAQKSATDMEHDEAAFVALDGASIEIRLPKHFDARKWIDIQLDSRWHPMPAYRKALLFIGLFLIFAGQWLLHCYRIAARNRMRPSAA